MIGYPPSVRLRSSLLLVALVLLPARLHADAAAPAVPIDPAVQKLLDAWLAAQNRGRFADYAALYAPAFHGIRRPARSGERTVELDRKKWLEDRKRMFARPQFVAARDVKATAAGDGFDVRFLQIWSSGSYSDRGEKRLTLVRRRRAADRARGDDALGPPRPRHPDQ